MVLDVGSLRKELDFNKEQFELTKHALMREKEHTNSMLVESEKKCQQLETELDEAKSQLRHLSQRLEDYENQGA